MTPKTRLTAKSILSLLLLVGSGFETPAQQIQRGSTSKSLNYGFVSPNTQEDLQLTDAIRRLNSPEETMLITRINNLTCVVRTRITSHRALGSWIDGAEYSVLLRVNSDEPTVRYLLSRVGKEAHQKSVLYFHPSQRGAARIYALRPRQKLRDLAKVAAIMESAGVAFRTLVPIKQTTIVYVVDLKRELHAKVVTAARKLGATLSSVRGSAKFIGDDSSAEKAQTVFDQEIKDYEANHPGLPKSCDLQKKL